MSLFAIVILSIIGSLFKVRTLRTQDSHLRCHKNGCNHTIVFL